MWGPRYRSPAPMSKPNKPGVVLPACTSQGCGGRDRWSLRFSQVSWINGLQQQKMDGERFNKTFDTGFWLPHTTHMWTHRNKTEQNSSDWKLNTWQWCECSKGLQRGRLSHLGLSDTVERSPWYQDDLTCGRPFEHWWDAPPGTMMVPGSHSGSSSLEDWDLERATKPRGACLLSASWTVRQEGFGNASDTMQVAGTGQLLCVTPPATQYMVLFALL